MPASCHAAIHGLCLFIPFAFIIVESNSHDFSISAENEIQCPATANMRGVGVAKAIEQVGVVATGFLKGIRKDRQRGEVECFVDSLCKKVHI